MRHCLQLETPLPEPSIPPIYFKKLVFENIHSFSERQELMLVDENDRPARWTLILGDNGVGKTTLLQCLTYMRPVFNEAPDDDDGGPPPKSIEPELARVNDNNTIKELVRSPGDIEARLEAQLSFGAALSDSKQPNKNGISTSVMIKRAGDNMAGFEADGECSKTGEKPDHEPLVLAYGAGRHPASPNQNRKRVFCDDTIAIDPVASLFEIEAPLCNVESLLYRLEFHSMKNNSKATEQLRNLKCLFADILPDIENPDDIKILGPPNPILPHGETGIQVTTPYGTVAIGQLGFGCQTMLAWIADIALRLHDYYPATLNPLHEPAIVIVDEIDLHLHPRWQRKIREHLIKHFPNIQFIATTYSPSMAQTFLRDRLAVLKRVGDHTEIINDPVVVADWRLDQVVTSDLFDLPSARPPDVEKYLARRQELVEKNNRSDDEEKELRELDRRAAELPTANSPEDQEAMDLIRHAAKVIQSKGKASL